MTESPMTQSPTPASPADAVDPARRRPTPEEVAAARPPRPSLLDVVRAQRKTVIVALVLMVAAFWVMGPLGKWETAALTATGIFLALANHVASELWLGRLISTGDEPTRGAIAGAAFTRLLVLSVVAIGVAVAFWPHGIALLLGLAIFRLIALVMTWIPLLKELKNA